MKTEVVVGSRSNPTLVRVLLSWNSPFIKYPKIGTWCYLFKTSQGLIVFDVGPYFNSMFGRVGSPTNNSNLILEAVKTFFPGTQISQIILSHYHFDHSQSAPDLQQKAQHQFNFLPPIRISNNDLLPKKFFHLFNISLSQVFLNAGFESWTLGEPIGDREKIGCSDFTIVHTPGHTSGDITLVSNIHKLTISGWWINDAQSSWMQWLQKNLIDEDKRSFKSTLGKLSKYKNYHHLYHHPLV